MFLIMRKYQNDLMTISHGIGEQLVVIVPDGNRNYAKYLQPLSTTASVYLIATDPIEVLQLMNSMKSKKSSGIDGLSMQFLKQAANEVSEPLSLAINKSISSGLVPPCLKEAKITPMFKANDPILYSNCRPMSILPPLSKILEKVIHKHLYGCY